MPHDLNLDLDLDLDTPQPGASLDNPLLRQNPLLSPLEQEVLEEYARLLDNMNKLSDKIAHLASQPAAGMLDGLRFLERKTATVCTLLKASVYSIVLQQQIYNGEAEGDSIGGGGAADDGGGVEGEEGKREDDTVGLGEDNGLGDLSRY